jgi:hypothetical protein
LRAFLILPIRATSSSHLVLLSLINIIIYEEEYKLLVSSLCSFLHQPLTSCFLVPITFLGTLFSNTVFPAGRETKCYTCIKRVNSLTDELIPWSRVLENVAKKFRALYGTWRCISMFTRSRHWTLTCSIWIHGHDCEEKESLPLAGIEPRSSILCVA